MTIVEVLLALLLAPFVLCFVLASLAAWVVIYCGLREAWAAVRRRAGLDTPGGSSLFSRADSRPPSRSRT